MICVLVTNNPHSSQWLSLFSLWLMSIFLINMPWLSIIINVLDFNKLFSCSSVWSNTTQGNLDKFQAVQNFTCCILCEKPKEICVWLATNQATTLFPFCCSGMMRTLNFWTYHSSWLLAAKGPFNFEQLLCGMSCSLGSNLAHVWQISRTCSGC